MPLYDMHCDGCEHTFEVEHAMSEPHPKKCPNCKKDKVRQAFNTPPPFHTRYSPMHPRVHRGRGH